jgi:hypothetical protein
MFRTEDLRRYGFSEFDGASYYRAFLMAAIDYGARSEPEEAAADGSVAFIIGAGRSGTTLMGRILKRQPCVHSVIEHGDTFTLGFAMAMYPELVSSCQAEIRNYIRIAYDTVLSLDPRLCSTCKPVCQEVLGRRPGEGCRPSTNVILKVAKDQANLFSVKVIREVFPGARFILMQRNGLDVVASMLHFERSASWTQLVQPINWRRNRFLGTHVDASFEQWNVRSQAAKAALRWHGAVAEQELLASTADILPVRYESLVTEMPAELGRIAEFLATPTLQYAPSTVHTKSVGSWRRRLTPQQIEDASALLAKSMQQLGYGEEVP